MDRFEAMEAFVAIVDAGSFVGAAGRLQVSKAVVSRHLAQLEQHLGVRLLHRTTRRLSLTPEGQVFVERSRELLSQWREASDELGHRHTQARGSLRINVPVSYGIARLSSLWGDFMRDNPQVLLDITLSDRISDLVEEGFDLAVRIGQLQSSSLVSRRVSAAQLILCAAPKYLTDAPSLQAPHDLAAHRVLSYSLLSSGDVWSFQTLGSAPQTRSVRVVPCMRSNNGDTCRAAAVDGQGIVLQPDFLVGRDLEAGRLVKLLPSWRASELGVYVVYPSRRYLSAKVRLQIDYLANRLRQ
jgi:DNA-binding transcriptional LysR family regulator